jgi:hypothetical protein
VREVQSKKESSPKVDTKDGIVMEVRDVHPLKDLSPKVDTKDGIVMEVRDVHPLKALVAIGAPEMDKKVPVFIVCKLGGRFTLNKRGQPPKVPNISVKFTKYDKFAETSKLH